jgi:hypothetical protein
MSQVRLLITGAWRLGDALVGLNDSPEWLRRTAASAVRQSVQTVLDTAIARGCHLIFVAGRIASPENFAVSAAWLRERAAVLKTRGIRLVLADHDADELSLLAPLDVVCVPAGSGFVVSRDGADLRLSNSTAPGDFRIVAGDSAARTTCDRSCRITAAGAFGGHLHVPAVSPQRLSADESSGGHCTVVTLDPLTGEMRVQEQTTQVLEFLQVEEFFEAGTTLPQLLKRLAERSRTLPRSGPVQLVDWRVGGQLRLSLWDDSAPREQDLLYALRGLLNAGHAGAWPLRLQFNDRFEVELCSGSSRLLTGICSRTMSGLGPGSEIPELLHQLQRVA